MRFPMLIAADRLMEWSKRLVLQLEREQGYPDAILKPAVASNAVSLDLRDATTFDITLDDDLSTITTTLPGPTDESPYRGTLILRQDGTGSHAVTFPAGWLWPGGSVPTVSSTADQFDIFELLVIDSVIHARTFGQNMS